MNDDKYTKYSRGLSELYERALLVYLLLEKARALKSENLTDAIAIAQDALCILESRTVSDEEVYWDCLLELVRICPKSTSPSTNNILINASVYWEYSC